MTGLRAVARRDWLGLGTIVVVSLALKAGFLLATDIPAPVQDAAGYLKRSQAIWESGVLRGPSERDIGSAPLYPLFLAPFVGMEGPAPRSALAAQAILSVLTVAAAWWLGWRTGAWWGGVGAGMLCVTHPPMTAYPFLYLTETLALAGLIGTMALLELLLSRIDRPAGPVGQRRAERALAAALGISVALAGLTRVVVFPVLAVVLILTLARLHREPTRAFTIGLAGFLGLAAVCWPWLLWNSGNSVQASVLSPRTPSIRLQAHLTAVFMAQGLDFAAARRMTTREQERIASGTVEITPPGPASLTFWRDTTHRLAIMLGIHPGVATPFPLTGHTTRGYPAVQALTYAWHALFYAGLLGAAWMAIRRPRIQLIALLTLPGVVFAAYTLIHAIPRYQILPFAAWTIPAGIALGRAAGSFVQRNNWPAPSMPATG